MKLMYSFLVVVFISASFISCSPKFLFDGRKVQAVTVRDLGEMYSTYNLSKAEKEQVLDQLTNKALLDEIIRYSKESTWPDAVNTLNERIAARTTMLKYHYYKVVSFGNKTIVSIPKEKNTHMPAAFIPSTPMYIIFNSSVVENK